MICSRSVCSRVFSSASSSDAAAGDFAPLRILFAPDALLGDGELLRQPRLLDRLARGELRFLGLLLAQRALLGQLGALHRAAELDLALLLEPGIFGLAIDLEDLLLRLQILAADIDQRALLDLVAHLAPRLDQLGELGQAFGIEGIRRIEEFQAGLIEVDDGDILQFEPVGGERFGGEIADLIGIVAALFVHLLERHLRRHHAHRGGKFSLQQAADAVLLQRAPAQSLRGGRHRRLGCADADEKFGDDVDAHAVAGDESAVFAAHHLDAHDVHVDRRDFVQHRNDEGAAIDHDLFTQEAGAHERRFFGGSAIEPAQDVDEDDNGDRDPDQPQQHFPKSVRTHLTLRSFSPALAVGRIRSAAQFERFRTARHSSF